ncbi:hypothetical protein ABZP36_002897 [Zizania latifolia]
MDMTRKGGDGGGEGDSDDEMTGRWRAKEVIAGNRVALKVLWELLMYPVLYALEAHVLSLNFPRGLLLHGLSGTKKKRMVRAIVRECNAHLTMIEARSSLRAFSEAYTQVSQGRPAVIFIDELDDICPPRCSRARVPRCWSALMDGNKKLSKMLPHIVVASATRSGNANCVVVPTAEERFEILKISFKNILYTKNLHLGEYVDLQSVAASCNDYVGADLQALFREAARLCGQKQCDKGVTKEIPAVSWDDIGGLKDLKKKLQQAVEWPIKHAASCDRLGISPIRGVLLHGPPGCSKTTLAKAAAHAAQASFFSLSGAELYSKYVGEGEALLRRTFQMARLASPSIIFFDEADVIAPKRTGPGGNSSGNATVGE